MIFAITNRFYAEIFHEARRLPFIVCRSPSDKCPQK
ncbi:MAG: hypothetical protein ACJAYJ_001355 [Saprospiraceae bacterium]|jgi:hypothetical protein